MSAWSTLRRAQKLARQGEPEKAADLLEEVCHKLDNEAAPAIQLGLVYLELNQLEQAVSQLEKACERAPENPAGPFFLSLALAQNDCLERAWQQAEQVHKIEPRHQALATLKTYLHLRQGEVGEALAQLGLGPQADHQNGELAASPPLLGRLVVELERQLLPNDIPRLERGSIWEQEAIDTREPPEPKSPGQVLKTHFPSWKAMSLQSRGKKLIERAIIKRDFPRAEEAIELFRQSRALDPSLLRSDFHLGEALLFSSRPSDTEPFRRDFLEEAVECLLNSWKKDGPTPYVFYYLGRSEQLLGRLEPAQHYFEQALKRFEKLPEANYGLAQCHLMLGREALARQRFLMAVGSDGLILARQRFSELAALVEHCPEKLGQPFPERPEEPEAESPSEEEATEAEPDG